MKLSATSIYFISLLLGLIAVFVVDPLDKSTVSTPLLLGIVLMVLSLRQGVYLVSAVSLTYCLLTLYALIQFHEYYTAHIHVSEHPFFWLFQRSGLFVVLCGLAIYLAHYRTGTERIISRFATVLGKLPVPVILSDASGHILFANEALAPILHQGAAELVGQNFFDYFQRGKMKGEFIRFYFELFEVDSSGTYELNVHPFGDAHTINAQMACLGSGPNRVMITVLENIDKTAAQPSFA